MADRRRVLKTLGLGTAAGAVIATGFVAGRFFDRREEAVELQLASDIPGFFWPNPPSLPQFALTDHQGNVLDRGRLEGKWSMLYFGYTSCPDACPITLSVFSQLEKELQDHNGYAAALQGIFISVDPARDKDKLGPYVTHFSPRLTGATGDDKAIMGIARPLGIVYLRRPPDENGEYLVDHSNSLLLIDPQARLVALFNGPHDAGQIASQMRRIFDVVAS